MYKESMRTKEYYVNEEKTVEILESGILIKSAQDFLDLLGEAGSRNIIIQKENVNEDFFDLSTRIAGDILQKASNYKIKLGIVGEYSHYKSKSLKDFIMESNKTKQILFVDSVSEVLRIWRSVDS
jgi:hypothetical protein